MGLSPGRSRQRSEASLEQVFARGHVKKITNLKKFPVVAIGASAGGLRAFTELLGALPREPGMAFVVVPHLAPQYKSNLAEILSRNTKLPIGEVKNGDKVLANRIYVLPPNRSMLIKGGALHLSSSGHKSDWRNPIDSFFNSLAADQGKNAIGVLLSGEGDDGTEGFKAIKKSGGRTFAQDEKTAAHTGMPHAAAVSGSVDFILSPAEIGRKLGSSPGSWRAQLQSVPKKITAEGALNDILELLCSVKGVEFEYYKKNTLRRRIQRRMALKRVGDVGKYLDMLKADHAEVGHLFSDLLITVTSFFREPEVFKALKSQIYPRLLKNRPHGAPIRIWIAGCSTGEEAYSHAINLAEYLGPRAAQTPFHIFATDVNPAVIEKARAGLYPRKIRAEISPERLRRFFTETKDGYRILPAIRERCIFTTKNLLKDPPFINLDLVSCRNVLIYFGPELQEKALQIFKYALKPRGVLMLGSAETTGDLSGSFSRLNVRKRAFFERTSTSNAPLDFLRFNRFLEPDPGLKSPAFGGDGQDRPARDGQDLQAELNNILPARYIPAGVIVNGDLEILRFLGDTSAYLRPAPGKPSMNLRSMAPGDLLLVLRSAIYLSKKSNSAVRRMATAAYAGGASGRVRIEVIPFKSATLSSDHFLILFEQACVVGTGKLRACEKRGGENRRIIELTGDLAASGEHLKSIIEEQESSNVKLKTSNEELLSSNEELQSINEEFETAKEELQSTNEELVTSTEELGEANRTLSLANSDFSNLLASVDIPIVLLGPDLAVRRFTPSAEKVLYLSTDKIGRLITEIQLPLLLPGLKQLLRGVLKTGHVQKLEVQDTQGRWYYLVIRPYQTEKSKTEKSRTEGAVLALIDIQDRKLAEKNVLRLATVVLDSNDAVILFNLKDRITAWNKGAQKMYGYTETEALGMNITRLIPEKMRMKVRDMVRISAAPIETRRRAKNGRILDVLLTVTVLRDEKGAPLEVATTERDITEQKLAERERKLSETIMLRLGASVLDSNDAFIICDLDDRIIAWNKGAQKMYGYTEAEALAMSIKRLMPENKLIRARELVRESAAPIEAQRRTRGGRILDVLLTVTVLRDDKGRPVEVATTERDITEQKRAERELRGLHSRALSAQETERKRLSRELHDGVGQILSGVKFRLESLPGEVNLDGTAAGKIVKVGGLLSQAISEIRRVSQNLMPSELVDLGLEPALRTLCREFKERAGVAVTLQTGNVPTDVSPGLELALFRISQEALNNVGKHSKATMASVNLSRKGKEVVLRVSDNGAGFVPGGKRQPGGRGIGLGSMRERAELLGGSLELNSKPGAGTTLIVRVPLAGSEGETI